MTAALKPSSHLASDNLTVDLKQLSRFAKHPLRFYLNHALHLYLEYEEKDEEFTLSPLVRALVHKEVGKRPLKEVFKEADLHGKLPLGRFKDVAWLNTSEEMQKVAGDANEKMAKAEFKDTLDSDPMYAGELYSKNLKNIPEEDREMGEEALFALQDVEMGLLDASDAEWAKEFLRKDILPHIKEGKDFDLRQLSKITTRYTNRIDEIVRMKGANNKLIKVPDSYSKKLGLFAHKFYKTSGMGGDLTSGVEFGYRRYHKLPPNDEFSGSVILKRDSMDIKKKDINLVMKNLKSVAKQNGINLYIMKYVPDRNEPFIEFKMRES